jgi:hypothetical protein
VDDWPGELKAMFSRQQEIWLRMGQLQNEVGKLVIASSDMENKLHLLFMALTAPADEKPALRVLEDQQSMEKKINLIDLLVHMQCTGDEQAQWASVYVLLNDSKFMRNYVAHQSAWISDQDTDAEIRVFLGPHSVAPKTTKLKEATAEHIGMACNKLLRARSEIMELIQAVGLRKGMLSQPVPAP